MMNLYQSIANPDNVLSVFDDWSVNPESVLSVFGDWSVNIGVLL